MREISIALMLGCCAAHGAELEAREWKDAAGTTVLHRFHAPASVEPGKSYPLVLFLHGAGERGADNTAQLKHGVLPILAGAEKIDQPCFLIAPQCPQGRWWAPINRETMRPSEPGQPNTLLDAVLALVAETAKTHPLDPLRIYVTGISMGGYATWDLLARAPDRFAAAVPVCGGGDPEMAKRFSSVPLWAFHGDADPVVPVRTTVEMTTALEKAGGKPKLTIYPGVTHDSWTATYDNPELIRWMFDQRRKSPELIGK